jgi:hypothetical protein
MGIRMQQDVEAERLKLELRLALLEGQERAKNTFIGFSQYVWPEAILSSHHKIMADAFDRIAKGNPEALDREHASSTHQIRICVVSAARLHHGP